MQFTNDDDLTLIEAGEYEVVIEKIEKKPYQVKATGANKVGVNVTFRIRGDVEQRFQNLRVWEFFYEAENSTPNDWWADVKKISKLARTCLKPNGQVDGKPQWFFKDCDTCIQDLIGTNLRVYIDKYLDDYTGQDRNAVKYLSYAPTQHPTTQAPTTTTQPTQPTQPAQPKSFDNIDINGLPF